MRVKVLIAFLLTVSLSNFFFAQEDVPEVNTEEIFNKALDYNKEMNRLDELVQRQRQKILNNDSLTTAQKKEMLQRLNKRSTFIGTSKTIDKRRPLINYLEKLGGEMGVGKLPEATDAAGNIKYGLVKPQQNPDFKGRYSDFDMQCQPSVCAKVKDELTRSGKFKIIDNGATFDIVAVPQGGNDMVKITFNAFDPSGDSVSLEQKIKNPETYTYVQITNQDGKLPDGNNKALQGLKAKDHFQKGKLTNNLEINCFSHSCDEKFNTSTKTAHKLIMDAPDFVNEADITTAIEKHDLRHAPIELRDSNGDVIRDANGKPKMVPPGELLTAKEFTKMLEDSYTGKKDRAYLNLELNDVNKFLDVRHTIVQETVNKIEVDQESIHNESVKRVNQQLKDGEIDKVEADRQKRLLNKIKQASDAYSSDPDYQKVAATKIAPKNITKRDNVLTTTSNQSVLGRLNKKNQEFGQQARDFENSRAGKILNRMNLVSGGMALGELYETVKESCGDDSACYEEVMASVAKDVVMEEVVDGVVQRFIPSYYQLKTAFDAGWQVGEAIDNNLLSTKVDDCSIGSDGKEVCVKKAINVKYLQDPTQRFLDNLNETPEQEKRNEFFAYAIKECEFYADDLKAENISCAQVVAESLENEDDPFMQRLNLEDKLSAISDTAWEKDRELQEILGCNPSFKYDCDNVNNQQKVADNSEIEPNYDGTLADLLGTNENQVSNGNEVGIVTDSSEAAEAPSFEGFFDDGYENEAIANQEEINEVQENYDSLNDMLNSTEAPIFYLADETVEDDFNSSDLSQLMGMSPEELEELERDLSNEESAQDLREIADYGDFSEVAEARQEKIKQAEQKRIAAEKARQERNEFWRDFGEALSSPEMAAALGTVTQEYLEQSREIDEQFNQERKEVEDSYNKDMAEIYNNYYSGIASSTPSNDGAPYVKSENSYSWQCNELRDNGGNEPEQYTITVPNSFSGGYQYFYDHIDEPDRARIYFNGRLVLDTQCVGGETTKPLNITGGGQVRIVIDPSCKGNNNSTAWSFKLICPVN